VSNAKDFVQAGAVTAYSTSGDSLYSFDTGIIPGSFLFIYDNTPLNTAYEDQIPENFDLLRAYPNPFNPSTNIQFELSEAGRVQLYVSDLLGRRVATLVDAVRTAGTHTVQFDAGNLASGIYLIQFRSGTVSATQKITLQR
jgi:hypothetical protein